MEKYICEFCKTEIAWDGVDENKGTIWSCEELKCGVVFCRSCFADKFSYAEFTKMTNEDDIIRCPSCYAENKALSGAV